MKKIILCTGLFLFFISSLVAQSNLPRSMEATGEERNGNEINLRAKGLGIDEDDPVTDGENDALKCAVYFILYNSNEKLLQTPEEKNNFGKIQEQFFELSNIKKFTYMSNSILSRVTKGDGVVVEKLVKVNYEKLREELQNLGIIKSVQDLSVEVSNPIIMVVPSAGTNENPLELLKNDDKVKHAAEVIQKYLITKNFQAQLPEQTEVMADYASAQEMLAGASVDESYKLAVSLGSDIYLSFRVNITHESLGKKASVSCNAYETTTALLLGSETGYSPVTPSSSDYALIDLAMTEAVNRLISQINVYWKNDLKTGLKYKVVFKFPEELNATEAEDMQFDVMDYIEKISKNSKMVNSTSHTLDYLIWINPSEAKDAMQLYRKFRKEYKSGNLSRVFSKGKILTLNVGL